MFNASSFSINAVFSLLELTATIALSCLPVPIARLSPFVQETQELSKHSTQIYGHLLLYLSLVPQNRKAHGLDVKFNAE